MMANGVGTKVSARKASLVARGGRTGRAPGQPRLALSSLVEDRKQQQQRLRTLDLTVAAASADSSAEPQTEDGWEEWAPDGVTVDGDIYEVSLPKPIGVTIARGNDGRCYVSKVNAARGTVDPRITPGDRLLRVSQSFGNETWEALNYGQVAYAIRTRNGDVYFQLQDRGGDMTIFDEKKETDTTKAMFAAERAGGNYGIGTKELQQRNYISKMEEARKRRELFDDGLEKFRAKDYEGALLDWENVLGLEPVNYMSDNFSKVSDIKKVASFNIACSYSQMGQVDAAIEALDEALACGFDRYEKCRADPNLAKVRDDPRFKPMMDKYDEPIINMDAINAVGKLFGFGK